MTSPQVPATAPELARLLPSSIINDALMRDMALALQPVLDGLQQDVEVPALYARIDTMEEDELRLLAFENRMLGAEWMLAQTLQDKRDLIKNAFQLNRLRGTRWAVERVFDLLRLRAEIKEWFEDAPPAPPFTFRIAVLDVGGRGILQSELALINELIEAYKPLTRHNAGINLEATVSGAIYAAGAVSFVASCEVQEARIGGDVEVVQAIRAAGAVSFTAGMHLQ